MVSMSDAKAGEMTRGGDGTAAHGWLLETAAAAVQAAGVIIADAAGFEPRVVSWKSHDMKIETDLRCEEAIVRCIRARCPNDSIFSEEAGLLAGEGDRTWVIDPLDGTVNFAHGLPFYASSVACVECRPEELAARWDKQIVAAAVVLPASGETYLAERGAGATMNGRRLSLHPFADLSKALVSLGTSVKDHGLPFALRMQELFATEAQKVRNLGALAGELAYVAAGRLDALVMRGTNLWDFAAAALIVREAGGRVSAHELSPGRWLVVAANPGLFPLVYGMAGPP
jgi:myo-inositol-1(or 4)-monophosphatase